MNYEESHLLAQRRALDAASERGSWARLRHLAAWISKKFLHVSLTWIDLDICNAHDVQ